jgi:hypothetical protein
VTSNGPKGSRGASPTPSAALAEAGDPGRAVACVATALSVGSWAELPLQEIGRVSPEVPVALAEALLG